MKRKFQVFISSTYSDLIAERQAAVEAILRAGHIPAGMELFSAGSETQLEIIKRWIDDSDVYMLLLGGRYGTLESKTGLSYTEIEYQYALENGKPTFAIIASEEFLDMKIKLKGKDILELKNRKKYDEFKELVLSKVCRFFNDQNDIKLTTLESLLDIQNRFDIRGWVNSSDVPDVTELLNQINVLADKNRELSDQVKVIESGQINKIGEYSYEELVTALKAIEIIVPANISKTKKVVNTNVLSLFIGNKTKLSIGVSNKMAALDDEMFLIRNVVSHLRIYDLVEIVKVPNVQWSKFQTSKLGNKFLAVNSITRQRVKK